MSFKVTFAVIVADNLCSVLSRPPLLEFAIWSSFVFIFAHLRIVIDFEIEVGGKGKALSFLGVDKYGF